MFEYTSNLPPWEVPHLNSKFGLRGVAREIQAANKQTSRQRYILTNRVSLEAAKDISPFYQPGTIKPIGSGGFANVFSVGKDTIFKIGTDQTPRPPKLEQILQPHSFRFVKGEGENVHGEYVNKLNIVVAPKAQSVYSHTDPKELKEWWGNRTSDLVRGVEGQGYSWKDAWVGNIGIHNNKPVIIDYGFIEKERLTVKGLLTKRIPYALRSHLAPGRKPVIEALSHSGIAKYLRKITGFGSGWQGIQTTVEPSMFLKRVGADQESIIKTIKDQATVDFFRQRIKEGGTFEHPHIHLDEMGNVIGADGRHRALAHLLENTERMQVIVKRNIAITAAAMKNGESAVKSVGEVSKFAKGARKMLRHL
jgi:hypothetical protein